MAKNTQSIDKSVQDAIDNYGKQIQTMKDFVSAVRQVPGMYIGPIGNRGFLNMFRETFQNSVDQLVLKMTSCDHIYVYYNEITHQVTVEDNGLGLPFNDMIRILTSQHTSKNYTKVKGEYSSGLNGIGAKVVNALSSKFIAESFRYDGEARKIEMSEGYATTKEPVKIPNKEKRQGTRITFFPCEDVLGDIALEWKSIYHLVKHIVSMTPIGSVVDFEAIDSNNASHKEKIVNTDGIITDLIMKTKFPLIKPIVLSEDNGEQRLEIAFCYDGGGEAGPDPNESVTSFCNFCPTTSGTHVDGAIDGICRWFTNYMNKIYLSNQKSKQKTVVNASDIRSGLNVMINAASLEPIFTGQAKEILSNEEMIPFAKNVIMNGLDQWSKSNPQDLSKLSKYFKDIAELRMKNEAGKAKIVTKYQQNTLTGLPAKYAKPTEEDRELIIVEGDSAGGSAKVARDVRYQGIFPIRGKISSAFEKTYHEFWSNAETQGIARIILNKDYTRKFDPIKDVKWDKIIFMADGDVDGAHISSLLLRFFILYMPQLIEAGKVYKALAPLYGFEHGKKIQYLTDQLDFVRYVQKAFIQNNTIKKNKKQLSGKEIGRAHV